jgi:hypothetical protein
MPEEESNFCALAVFSPPINQLRGKTGRERQPVQGSVNKLSGAHPVFAQLLDQRGTPHA